MPLFLVAFIQSASPSWAAPVFFADANLKTAVENRLGVTDPEPTDMLALTSLSANSSGIMDLTGLEAATNLTVLSLSNNQISDVSALSGLSALLDLRLAKNQIGDISALTGLANLGLLLVNDNQISSVPSLSALTSLNFLSLNNNQVPDITGLSGLISLRTLLLANNQISDISTLSGLTTLVTLYLTSNQIGDVSALSGLSALLDLRLGKNQISDISALAGLTNLGLLLVNDNQISSVPSLSALSSLNFLSLNNNQVPDITGLSGLISLRTLLLANNQISDISTLSGLTTLVTLYLTSNQISDVSALSGHSALLDLRLQSNPLGILAYCRDLPTIEGNNPGIFLLVDLNPFSSCNTAPTAAAGVDQTVECVFSTGTSVTLNGTGSSDPDEDPLTFSWSAPGITFDDPLSATPTAAFPLGMTTVTLIVTDPSDESDTDQVVITVEDTTPPTVSVTASPESLWPPNHKYKGITLTVSVSDACDASPVVSATVISSEADDANGKGDGKSTGDIKVTTAAGAILLSSNTAPEVAFDPVNDQLELRAERSGSGDGRVYTVTVTAADGSGKTASSTATVAVAHDQGTAKVVAANLDFDTANYPNPFNPSTTIRYSLPEAATVRLTIYSVLGQQVRELVDAVQGAGVYQVAWDGRDRAGQSLAPGVYLYRLEAGQQVMVRKMVLAK